MRDEGWGSRCVKRFTVAMSAVSAEKLQFVEVLGSLPRVLVVAHHGHGHGTPRPGSRPTFFVVLSLFSKSFPILQARVSPAKGYPRQSFPRPLVLQTEVHGQVVAHAHGLSALLAGRPHGRLLATRAPPRPTASGRGSEAPGCWSDDRPSRSRKSPSHDPEMLFSSAICGNFTLLCTHWRNLLRSPPWNEGIVSTMMNGWSSSMTSLLDLHDGLDGVVLVELVERKFGGDLRIVGHDIQNVRNHLHLDLLGRLGRLLVLTRDLGHLPPPQPPFPHRFSESGAPSAYS